MGNSQGIDIGEAGRNVAANVRHHRERHRLTYKELSERLDAAGRPINAESIRRIEDGARRVDVADLVALAEALETTVNRLLTPISAEAILDEVMASASPAWIDILADRLEARRRELAGEPYARREES